MRDWRVRRWNSKRRCTGSKLPGSVLTAQRTLELAAHSLYLTRNHSERGQLLKSVLLNCVTDGVNLTPAYRNPLDLIVERVNNEDWSGRLDLNQRPHAPQSCALPGCATSRPIERSRSLSKKPRGRWVKGQHLRPYLRFKAITAAPKASRKHATHRADPAASCGSGVAQVLRRNWLCRRRFRPPANDVAPPQWCTLHRKAGA